MNSVHPKMHPSKSFGEDTTIWEVSTVNFATEIFQSQFYDQYRYSPCFRPSECFCAPSASERLWGGQSPSSPFSATIQPFGMIFDTFSSATNVPDTMETQSDTLCERNAKTYTATQKPTPVVGKSDNPKSFHFRIDPAHHIL